MKQIEDLIEIDRKKIPFDNADFLVSVEDQENQGEKIRNFEDSIESGYHPRPFKTENILEVMKSGLFTGVSVFYFTNAFCENPTINVILPCIGAGIGAYIGYSSQKIELGR